VDKLIRGFTFEEVQSAVSQVEKALGIPRPSQPVVYRRVAEWFVRADYFKQCWRSLGAEDAGVVVPWFAMKPWSNALLKVIKRYHFFTTYRAQTAATVIYVKNNVRTFYLDSPQPMTAKVLLSKTRDLDNMRREIETRAQLSQYRTLPLPQILRSDLNATPPFLAEELVTGRPLHRRRDAADLLAKLCPQLWQTYQQHGLVLKPVRERPDSGDAAEMLRKICAAHLWEKGWIEKEHFIRKACELLESDFTIPFSVGHGDIRSQNIIVRLDGTIFLLDWESAHEMPVISDILDLTLRVPETRPFFSEQMEALSRQNPDKKVLGFRGQLFFAVVDRLVRYAQQRSLRKPRKFQDELACASQVLTEGASLTAAG
jgi:hypothetical protein